MFYNISRGSSRENILCKTYSYFSPSRIAQKAYGKYCGHKKASRKRDRIRLFGNTIRLSDDFLIASADTIRMLADRIKIFTIRNKLFSPSKKLKQSFFSIFWHTKEA